MIRPFLGSLLEFEEGLAVELISAETAFGILNFLTSTVKII